MKLIKYLFIALFLAVSLSSCDKDQDENTIVVGTSADNPPYEFMQNGEIVGIDIDIIEAIAKKLNKKIVIKNMDLHGLLAALGTKNVDLVIAALSITPDRLPRVTFSAPYAMAHIAILFRAADRFKSMDDLKEKTVGAQLGSMWAQVAREISVEQKSKVQTLANNLTLVQELKNGTIDAIIMEEYQTKKFAEKHKELASFTLPEFGSEFAIAMPKRNSEKLKEKIDQAINELKAERVIEEIERKWTQ